MSTIASMKSLSPRFHLPSDLGRADGALGRPAEDADFRPSPPSNNLDPSDPVVLGKLERLDDLVFDAISGSREALEQLTDFWLQVRDELGDSPLFAESREQYLRYALASWDKLAQRTGTRNPNLAMQSLEVLCLLFEGAA